MGSEMDRERDGQFEKVGGCKGEDKGSRNGRGTRWRGGERTKGEWETGSGKMSEDSDMCVA
jgi:hypothetical protein